MRLEMIGSPGNIAGELVEITVIPAICNGFSTTFCSFIFTFPRVVVGLEAAGGQKCQGGIPLGWLFTTGFASSLFPRLVLGETPATSVEGVINLRGRFIPVVDLRKRFSLDAKASNNESRIIVVEVGRRVLRFVVDRVNEVLRVIGSIVEPAPALASGVDSQYVRGVGKLNDRLLILLDLNRLFLTRELHTAQAAALPQAA